MLPTSAGVEPATSWSPVGRRIQLSHRGRRDNSGIIFLQFYINVYMLCCGYAFNIYIYISMPLADPQWGISNEYSQYFMENWRKLSQSYPQILLNMSSYIQSMMPLTWHLLFTLSPLGFFKWTFPSLDLGMSTTVNLGSQYEIENIMANSVEWIYIVSKGLFFFFLFFFWFDFFFFFFFLVCRVERNTFC